jgi:hypothetical protein
VERRAKIYFGRPNISLFWVFVAIMDAVQCVVSPIPNSLVVGNKKEAVSKVNFAAASYFMECYIFD